MATIQGDDSSDEELDRLIEAMRQMPVPEGEEKKTFDQMLEELDNHPAFTKDIDPSKPMSEEMEGLMRLKYECEDPTAKADAYKDDGNHEFKKKAYRVAIDNYTEGIKCLCPDKNLNAILYCNRAAAQYHLENFRSALYDCGVSRKFKPNHMKAILRGAQCCLEMKKYNQCISWCDDALKIDSKDAKILEIRLKAAKLQKAIDRDLRKEKQQERKANMEEMKLIKAIQSRGIKLAGIQKSDDSKLDQTLLTSLEVHNTQGTKVHMDSNNILYWPVMFLYPEHTETDYIQTFSENHRLIDHLNHMFGFETEPPPWDPEKKYKPHTINIYFEDRDKEKLHKVNKESTLLKVLQHESYKVCGGTPSFILTVAGSPFEKSFLKKYGIL